MAFYIVQKRVTPFGKEKKEAYYLIAKSWDKIGFDELTASMVKNTTLSQQEAMTALAYLEQEIPRFIEMGMTIDLGKLGHFQLAIRSEGSDTPEEATWHKITDKRLCFVPSKELREKIRNIRMEQFPQPEPSLTGTGSGNRAMRKARQDALREKSIETARQCLAEGLSIEQAARISGLPEEEIEGCKGQGTGR